MRPVCQSSVPVRLFCVSSCALSVRWVIGAGVLVRVLVIVAHLSITRSLREPFANDSNEKRAGGGDREEGRRAEPKKRGDSKDDSSESQMFALVSSSMICPLLIAPHAPSVDIWTCLINATSDNLQR